MNTDRCNHFLCPLYPDVLNAVPGRGPMPSWIMEVGEAPGQQERARGKPFVGKSGQENDKYLLDVGIDPGVVRINNCIACRPPDNRDPSSEELVYCHDRLLQEIILTRPRYILTLGRFATQWFLGSEAKMETHHGIPFKWPDDPNITIIPIYHPSYGLHDGSKMVLIQNDFLAAKRTINGVIKPREMTDDAGNKYVYKEITSRDELWDKFARPEAGYNLVAIDTESILSGDKPNPRLDTAWCLTFAVDASHGYMVKMNDPVTIDMMNRWVSRPGVLTIFHNAGYDLDVLAYLGIVPARFTCTMTMAYLLQDQPQGLKALSYCLLGVKMTEYSAVVSDSTQVIAFDYATGLTATDWPVPPKIEHWVGNVRKTKQPQGLNKKITRALNDWVKSEGRMDLYDRIKKNIIEYRKQTGIDIPIPQPGSLADVEPELAKDYACRDAVCTFNIYPILQERITSEGLQETLDRDMGMLPLVIDMQSHGIKIDPEHFIGLEKYFDDRMEEVRKDFVESYNEINYDFEFDINLGSTQQVARALYDIGVFPSPTASTEKKELDKYRAKNPIIDLVTEYKECQKLRGTYTKPLVLKADTNNRIHTRFRTTRTITGRLSSQDPNLQNQPIRSEDGKKIREGFIPEPGYSFLSCDYSQIEMRIAAHISQDPKMLEVFWTGVDIHSQTAAWAFNIDINDVDDDKQRRPCKSTGFGILYGIGTPGLQAQLQSQGLVFTEAKCQEFINMWFGIYGGIKSMMDGYKSEARRYGKVRDMFGRYRTVPEVKSALKWVISRGLREACNSPIQSAAQGVIKEAMKQLVPVCRDYGQEIIRPLLQIHDDLLFEIRDDMFDILTPVVVDVMEHAVVLSVPTPVDPKMSKSNWRELKAWQKE